jgi:benzoylformate decarboxylase
VSPALLPLSDGAHAIFEVLKQWGVDLMFTCPGSTEASVLDASLDNPEIRLVLTTHECVAVAAADAFARVADRPAVAYLHANVGLANAVANLACASAAQSATIILNGLKSTEIANRGGYTTAQYQIEHVRQYVRSACVVLKTSAIAEDLTRALQRAVSDPGGPVYLGLHQDLVEAPFEGGIPQATERRVSSKRRPDPAQIARAVELLNAAQRPVILAGSSIAKPDARRLLTMLATRLGAPIVIEDRRTIAANGVLGDDSGFAGVYDPANLAVSDCDLVLIAGQSSFVEFEAFRTSPVPPNARVIHAFSEPSEIAKIDRVDAGLAGNVSLTLADLIAALGSSGRASQSAVAHRENSIAAFQRSHNEQTAVLRERFNESIIEPLVLGCALADALPNDCFVIADAVTSNGYLIDTLLPNSRRELITTTGGSLGWGMGAAIGVRFALPDVPLVAVIGDGVFQFGLQALWTAVECKLRMTFVVIDNASYAAVKAALKRYRVRSGTERASFPASEIPGPDIAAISRGFGAYAESIDKLADLPSALARAFAAEGPSVLVVRTNPLHTGP